MKTLETKANNGKGQVEQKTPEPPMTDVVSSKKYVAAERIWMKDSDLTEHWVEMLIKNNPALLGLEADGELDVQSQRPVGLGRLDLLLQDSESDRRYEVELQLGPTDPSHIIRAIEYWDIERKLYPECDHCAVLVAEDITSRFLNVISVLNGAIPFIAIQMQALKVGDHVTLMFTTVLDKMTRPEEKPLTGPGSSREEWVRKASEKTVNLATDDLFSILRKFDPVVRPTYLKHYIGVMRNQEPCNFVRFAPKRERVNLYLKLASSKDIDDKLDAAGVAMLTRSKRDQEYKLSLSEDDIKNNQSLLRELMLQAFEKRCT